MQEIRQDNGQVMHGSRAGVHVLRFIGDIRYPLAPSLARFFEQLVKASELTGVVVDLTQTSCIDSTNLGQLARLANSMNARHHQRVTIVSDRKDINEVLTSMGFRDVFDIVDGANDVDEPASASCGTEHPVDACNVSSKALTQVMLEAHQTLMELNARNRDQFHDVVDLLAQRV